MTHYIARPWSAHIYIQGSHVKVTAGVAAEVECVRRRRGNAGMETYKDKPHARPRLPDNHGHILARETKRTHADEVKHPVNEEGALSVGIRVPVFDERGPHLRGDRVAAGKVDLECQGDEGVGKGEEEIGGDGAEPADYDELDKFEGWVALRFEELWSCC